MNNVTNQVPFLKTSRLFPEEPHQLVTEINKAYIDIANCVNARTIGSFSVNRPTVGGENWFITNNQRQQNFRQIYTFTATGNIAHGLNFSSIERFTKPQGSFYDGTNYYGCIYASSTAIAGQVSFYITPTNIVVVSGGGAPTITSGTIVLEWISKP